jgi:hypothetical protein
MHRTPKEDRRVDSRLLSLCRILRIDPNALEAVFRQDDWAFCILIGTFLEAVGFWRLERLARGAGATDKAKTLYNKALRKNKLPIAADMYRALQESGHISPAAGDFLLALCRLRNTLAHTVRWMDFSFAAGDQPAELEPLRRSLAAFLPSAETEGQPLRRTVEKAVVDAVSEEIMYGEEEPVTGSHGAGADTPA